VRELRPRSAVVLDRHPLWLDAMDRLLAAIGVDVVGRSTDADEAVDLVEQYEPDVLIAGIDASQLPAVRRAKALAPDVQVVVVGDDAEPELVKSAFAAGASVYCAKTAQPDDLASAIRQVFRRSIFMAAPDERESPAVEVRSVVAPVPHDLTRRELEVLRLVAEGHSNSELAKMLWVTEQTIKFHLSNTYRKLNVANRTEASRWAQVNGLLLSETTDPISDNVAA
jgi:DNA-binding NarL/FixJ family response regulator